jgi:hypothetical protein
VRAQVKAFKATEEKLLEKLAGKGAREKQAPEEELMAKFLEEMKGLVRELPSRIAEKVGESGEPTRRKRFRRFHPTMIEELLHMGGDAQDPIGLLIMASMFRDDLPWLYEIALEAYHALRTGDLPGADREMVRLRGMTEMFMRGPFAEELGVGGREAHMWLMEMPHMFEGMIRRCRESKKPARRRRSPVPEQA